MCGMSRTIVSWVEHEIWGRSPFLCFTAVNSLPAQLPIVDMTLLSNLCWLDPTMYFREYLARLVEPVVVRFPLTIRICKLQLIAADKLRYQLVYLAQGDLRTVSMHSLIPTAEVYSHSCRYRFAIHHRTARIIRSVGRFRSTEYTYMQHAPLHLYSVLAQPPVRIEFIRISPKDTRIPLNNCRIHANPCARFEAFA